MADNILVPTGVAVPSPVIDYELRNMTREVSDLRVDQMLVYNASAGTLPAIVGAGDFSFVTPDGSVTIPFRDIFGAAVYQAVTAVAGVWQVDLDATSCLPDGNSLSLGVIRQNDSDALPLENPFYYAFDPSCTYTASQKIATVVASFNAQKPKFATASANGTTGIFITSDVAGDYLTVTAGAGFLNAVQNTAPKAAFGTGTNLARYAPLSVIKAGTLVAGTSYRIIEIRYWKRIHAAGHGFATAQTDQNNAMVQVRKKAWIVFDAASTQDTNYNAATALIFPSELRFRLVTSLTPSN